MFGGNEEYVPTGGSMSPGRNSQDRSQFAIVPMESSDAHAAGVLHEVGIPESIFSKLGTRFTARFLRWIQEQAHSEVWIARDEQQNVVSVRGWGIS